MRQRLLWSAILLSLMLFRSASQAQTVRLEEPDARRVVQEVWNQEYQELAGQIKRLKNWNGVSRDRLRAEALDKQALTLPDDKDPIDIVLRRTGALLQHFKKEGRLSSSLLSGFETQLNKLSASEKSTSSGDARKALFTRVCELRRKIALANPLLDFDSIVCMLEQPGDARIIEQARASWGGHSKGGGPIIIRNFKSQPKIDKLLAGVSVASGPWKDKELSGFFSGLELSYDWPAPQNLIHVL